MVKVYVLFWFDVEDCTVTQSDDAAKRIAEILTKHGVRGTFKVVGQKARILRQRIRYDVVDALSLHAIGYHSNWHGLRPQVAEYLAPLEWEDGAAEFERQEWSGIEDIHELFRKYPCCYGQAGSNWAPQVFPTLRKWNIKTYVSGYGYVGINCQPFWYGGLLNTSKMSGRREDGKEAQHMIGLNFELGKPGALEEHKRLFDAAYESLKESGGLISIMNHPCTLVLERWFSTDMKTRELTEAGYKHFEEFVEYVLPHKDVRTVTADELLDIYPDRAQGRIFSRDELLELARNVGEEAKFQVFKSMSLSAAELFGMFVRFIARIGLESSLSVGEICTYLDGPARRVKDTESGFKVPWGEFVESAVGVARFITDQRRMPNEISFSGKSVQPADYLVSAANAISRLLDTGRAPKQVTILYGMNAFEKYVDESATQSGWRGSMMLPGFEAPKLLELAKLQAWTIKPAVLYMR